jgi:hypothetical protein
MNNAMGNRPHDPRRPDESKDPQTRPLENDIIRSLKARPGHSLYAMALFIALSIGAMRDFDFIPSLPPAIRELLGQPPSADMVSAALLIYSFSAIIKVLARMMSGDGKFSGFAHVAFLAGFYFFYHFTGAMEENFWAVFAAGMTILGLGSYHIWAWCAEEIRKEEESLTGKGRGRNNKTDA